MCDNKDRRVRWFDLKQNKYNLKELGFPVFYYLALVFLFIGILLILITNALENAGHQEAYITILSVLGLVLMGTGLILVILNRKKVIQFYVKLSYHQEMRTTLSMHHQEETFDSIRQKMIDKDFVYIKNHFLYHKVFTLSKVYMQYFVLLKESDDANETIQEFLKHMDSINDFAKGIVKNPNKVMVLMLYMKKATKEDLSAIKMRIETSVAIQNDYSHPSITILPILYDQSLKGFIFRNNTKMQRKNNYKMAMRHMKRLFFDSNEHSLFHFYDEPNPTQE